MPASRESLSSLRSSAGRAVVKPVDDQLAAVVVEGGEAKLPATDFPVVAHPWTGDAGLFGLG
jgi:hypothetical protein